MSKVMKLHSAVKDGDLTGIKTLLDENRGVSELAERDGCKRYISAACCG